MEKESELCKQLGGVTDAASYATSLRALPSGKLFMRDALGTNAVCACGTPASRSESRDLEFVEAFIYTVPVSRARVLLADAASAWHDELLSALGTDASVVESTTDAGKLAETLVSAEWKVVVVGEGLVGGSGFDAIYLASKSRSPDVQGARRTRPILLLVLDVVHDTELLSLLTSRGVDGFLRRTEPVEASAARIRSCMYVEERVAAREHIDAKANVEIAGTSVRGTLEDLSVGGAQLVIPKKKSGPTLQIGTTLSFDALVEEVPLKLSCTLRRVDVRKGILGDRHALGVSFNALEFDQKKAIETALERVRAAQKSALDQASMYPRRWM